MELAVFHPSGVYNFDMTPTFLQVGGSAIAIQKSNWQYGAEWYSMKQGTTQRLMSHVVHLYTVPFLWPRDEQR